MVLQVGCIGVQQFVVSTDSGSQVSEEIVFTQPPSTATPAVSHVNGYPIELSVFGLSLFSSSDLEVQLDMHGQSVVVAAPYLISSVAEGWTVLNITAPTATSAGKVRGTVIHTTQGSNRTFDIHYIKPAMTSLQPSWCYTMSVCDVVVSLDNFPTTFSSDLLECHIGTTKLDVLSSYASGFGLLDTAATGTQSVVATIRISRSSVPGVSTVKCRHRERPEALSTTSTFAYVAAPLAMKLSGDEGSTAGGTILWMEIDHLYITSILNVSIQFDLQSSSDSLYPAASEIMYSQPSTSTSAARTKIKVTTPTSTGGADQVI